MRGAVSAPRWLLEMRRRDMHRKRGFSATISSNLDIVIYREISDAFGVS